MKQDEVKDSVYYARGTYYFVATCGQLVPVNRHAARVHLRCAGLTRQEAERYLDEVKAYYVAHPDESLEVKKRYIREGVGRELSEDDVTEVALHGWRKIRERDARRWRNGEAD